MKNRSLIFSTGLAVLAAAAATGAAHQSGAAQNAGIACPIKALPLQTNSIAPATKVALAAEDAATKPQVVSASLATADPDWGPDVASQCGAAARKKTVIVHITLRAFNSASLSSRVDFVARYPGGYKIWEVAH